MGAGRRVLHQIQNSVLEGQGSGHEPVCQEHVPEEDFRALLFGHLPKCDKLDDYKFKRLHKFFELDNSDIVIVIKPYNHPLFFLTQKALDLLNGVNSI